MMMTFNYENNIENRLTHNYRHSHTLITHVNVYSQTREN